MDGELVFWSIDVPDVPRGQRFFGALFGWAFSAPGPTGAVRIEGRPAALHPAGINDPQAVWLSADDLPATAARAAALGGGATPPQPTPWGARSVLSGPDGLRVALARSDEPSGPVGVRDGHGELAAWYLPSGGDDFLARLFGRAPAGPPALPRPDPGAGVFAFAVDDLAAARAEVARLGGRVTRADRDRTTAVDDQGYPFTLVARADQRRIAS